MLAELLESFSNAEDMFPYENTPGNTVTQEYGKEQAVSFITSS